jgi:hypothetical protein
MSGTRLPMHGRNHRPKGWYGPDDPGGSDPLNWMIDPAAGRGDEIILRQEPAAFWKFNELSGTVAQDWSGNGWDMSVADTEPPSRNPPSWGNPSGPPGDTTADFTSADTNRPGMANILFPQFAGDFTATMWAYKTQNGVQRAIGQGTPPEGIGGWMLTLGWGSGGPETPILWVGQEGPQASESLTGSAVALTTWAHYAVVHVGNGWQLYINGELDGTLTPTITYTPRETVHVGAPPGGGGGGWRLDSRVSYTAVFNRALTAQEIRTQYEGTYRTGRTVEANYTIDRRDTLLFAVNTITLTLPTALNHPGDEKTIKNKGSGTVTVTAPGTEQIDGAGSPGSFTLAAGKAARVGSDGIGWYRIGGY